MQDIGKIKCVVPIQTGQISLGETGMVYTSNNGKSYLLTYKYFNSLVTNKLDRYEREQAKQSEQA